MNSVDRMNHLRSSNPEKRREKHHGISVFTYMIDLAVIFGCATLNKIADKDTHNNVSFKEFKQIVCEEFVMSQR